MSSNVNSLVGFLKWTRCNILITKWTQYSTTPFLFIHTHNCWITLQLFILVYLSLNMIYIIAITNIRFPWCYDSRISHDDGIKWKHFPRYWPFVRGIHRSPSQRPVTRSFDVFFDMCSNKRLSKQWRGWWFETESCPLCRHRNVSNYVMALSPVVCARWN